MRYTQAKTCGIVSWSTRQHVKCRRHECWLTNEEFIPGQSPCMHLVQTECERIPDKPVINGDSWKSWLLNEQQLRMTSVSYVKGTSLSHLVAVFK
ncbi:uncharacterized protein LOC142804287 isoform X2 [Rhipicephalus microplus]|uniref:uncharacterized protein LOC142804287 isoform X2 n=1 Tax=Rhipicephalus microplus TaxID=6941 RepID=UPI003F6A84F8